MTNKIAAITLLLAVGALLTALPSQAVAQQTCAVLSDWPLKPDGFAVGQSFRLVFITSKKRKARDTNILGYNSFVRSAVANGHQDIRACARQFRALGSTSAVDARDNISLPATGGVPLYWLNGPKIADDYADFWDGSWDHQSNGRQEDGMNINPVRVWTGTRGSGSPEADRGTKQASSHIGATQSVMTGHLNSEPIAIGTAGLKPPAEEYHIYGVSPLFTVVDIIASLERTGAASVYEEGGRIEFTVTLSRALASGERVDVPLVISGEDISADDFDDLANEGDGALNRGVTLEDTDSTTPTVVFKGDGAQVATLVLAVTNDKALESDKTATIAFGDLESEPDTNVTLGADEQRNAFEVEIKDNEYTFCFEKTTYIVDESVGEAVLQVNLSRPLNIDIIVRFSYIELTDVRGSENVQNLNNADYITQYADPIYAVIQKGATEFFLRIPVIDDQRVEGDDLIRIVAVPPDLPLGYLYCTADLIIKNNDPQVTINLGDVTKISLGDKIPFIVHGSNPRTTKLKVFVQQQDDFGETILAPKTITIKPVPLTTDTTVNLTVSESGDGDFISSSNEGADKSVTIPMGEIMAVYYVPSNSSNSGTGPSELTVELRGPDDSDDYFFGTPSQASAIIRENKILPPSIFVRSKVFLEGPLP